MNGVTFGRIAKSLAAVALLFGAGAFTPAGATPITFTATGTNPNPGGNSLAASVTFTVSGTNLIVTLTNTSTADVNIPTDVLTAVFFNVNTDPAVTLTPVSAVLGAGSTVLFAPAGGSGPNVGGEWAYATGINGPGAATSGNSSSGLGLFGGGNFNGPDLQGPPSGAVDGGQYGITSAGDNPATGNAAVTGNEALIKNSVVFTLSGLPAGFDPSTQISDVSFQYGTALTDPNLTGSSVPEPGSMLLLGSGLLGLGFLRRRGRAAA